MYPLFHRINEERFNQDVDLLNTKLQLITCKTVSLVKNDNINSRNHRYYHSDGIHLSSSGNLELVRTIKSYMNPALGLRNYSTITNFLVNFIQRKLTITTFRYHPLCKTHRYGLTSPYRNAK